MGRTSRALTQSAFNELLRALDPDRERAGERYERLRRSLVLHFRSRGIPDSEHYADETLTAAATRMARGEIVHNVPAYCLGIARLVAFEGYRAQAREQAAAREAAMMPMTPEEDAGDARESFVRCLAQLPDEQRRLILDYYAGAVDERIATRKRLAARLGIPLNALRIRAHRIRLQLERAMQKSAGVGP